MTTVVLKKGEGRLLKQGGLWIFDNEIDTITGSFKNGDIVTVHDFDGYPMGKGYINQNSKIRIRMMTRNADEEIDEKFLYNRVKAAWDYRKSVMGSDVSSCRIIFGEADFLPGLTVDKYEDVLVMEVLSLGMDRMKEQVASLLTRIFDEDGISIRGIYERSDAKERKKEGLELHKGFIGSSFDTDVAIVENGVCYLVDVVNGQKTGFFLDQKYNRLAMQRLVGGLVANRLSDLLSKDKQLDTAGNAITPIRMLDCFTHMGTFALNCGLAARSAIDELVNDLKLDDSKRSELYDLVSVTGLDISEFAVGQATENATRNGLDTIVDFRAANVLDELPKLYEAGEKYDVVILDPPAFTKSKDATKNAIKGYREINMKGMKLIKDGGYLATCSCSHFMTQELFTQVIAQAAKAVHKRLRQVEFRTQAPDHPILWSANESYYLKFYVFQVVDEK